MAKRHLIHHLFDTQSTENISSQQKVSIHAQRFTTPLGDMVATADENFVYSLSFLDNTKTQNTIQDLLKWNPTLFARKTPLLTTLEQELRLYFEGLFPSFTIPICATGTSFQKHVWAQLQTSCSTTQSYKDIAIAIDQPTAHRAVAKAIRENPILLITPCHRIIRADGSLGGYSGGIYRKKWLLHHEYSRSTL